MSISYENTNHNALSPQNVLSPPDRSQQQQQPSAPSPYTNNQEALLKLIISQPNLAEQLVRQINNGTLNTPTPVTSPQQPQVQYQMQSSPYRQQVPMQIPQQRQVIQPMYHQPQTQIYHPSQVQFQHQQPYFSQHQPQVVYQQPVQRSASPSVIHYLPNNTNQATFVPQTQRFPVYQTNGTDHIPQQFLERMNIWNISDENLNQTTTNSNQQPMTTNEVEKKTSLNLIFIYCVDIFVIFNYRKTFLMNWKLLERICCASIVKHTLENI